MKLRRNLNLFTISQEAVIVQYDDRRIHQPAAIHLCCIITGRIGKSAEGFHLFAHFFLCNDPLRHRLLIYNSAFQSVNPLNTFCFFKSIRIRVFHSNHHIPYSLIPFKIGLPCADPGKGKKALHHSKRHKRRDKG